MESREVSNERSTEEEESELFVTDCVDDGRYLIMRLFRLAVVLLCEYGFVRTLLYTARGLLYGLGFRASSMSGTELLWRHQPIRLLYYVVKGGISWSEYTMICPWPGFVLSLAGLVGAWYLLYAVGLPYRFESTKPGINARRCLRCRVAVPNYWFCSNCRAFRPAKIVSSVLLAGSYVVTMLFALNDFLLFLFSLYCMSGKRK